MWLHRGRTFHSLEPLRKFSNSPWFLSSYPFSDIPHKKSKQAPLQERRMIDRFRLWAKGGDGGNGCSSLRRGRSDRRGKPDGGNGGRGGDVILECSSTIWDFSSLQHHINAKRGGHGASKNKIGTRGEDKIVRVPVGTVIHLLEGEVSSTVEKKSSAALNPWDMPGTLDVTQPENALLSISDLPTSEERVETKKNSALSANDAETVCRLSSVKKATDATLIEPLSHSSRSCQEPSVEQLDFDHPPETDHDSYESEWGEENDENDAMQYDIAELTEPGQRIIVAQGGEGGLGNVSSIKGSKKRTLEPENEVTSDTDVLGDEGSSPSVGMPGSEVVLVLELKSIADVGLVGMPNAGKSTLLGAMSKAKPTVGHYAFTTLRPNLGNLNFDDFSVTVADIPGLIRGAHENRGLGHAFLRHIERTKVLAYVLDLSAALDGRKGLPPWEQLRDLVLELEFYREGLSDRPCLVVANKIDEEGAEVVFEDLKRRVPSVPVFPVCAVLEEGILAVRDGLKKLVNGGESYRLNLLDIIVD